MLITDYTKLNVCLITIILSIFAFGGGNLAYESMRNTVKTEEVYQEIETQEIVKETIEVDKIVEKILSQTLKREERIWEIEIPSIDLIAPIAQGTTQEVMLEYVGHFENTNFWEGNIGLAAHNRRISNKLF